MIFKVALFKSMAAAVDWANGLEITSGSFQVAEVAPAMRRAFEKEVGAYGTLGDLVPAAGTWLPLGVDVACPGVGGGSLSVFWSAA